MQELPVHPENSKNVHHTEFDDESTHNILNKTLVNEPPPLYVTPDLMSEPQVELQRTYQNGRLTRNPVIFTDEKQKEQFLSKQLGTVDTIMQPHIPNAT